MRVSERRPLPGHFGQGHVVRDGVWNVGVHVSTCKMHGKQQRREEEKANEHVHREVFVGLNDLLATNLSTSTVSVSKRVGVPENMDNWAKAATAHAQRGNTTRKQKRDT